LIIRKEKILKRKECMISLKCAQMSLLKGNLVRLKPKERNKPGFTEF
jgi:hypothetical protein